MESKHLMADPVYSYSYSANGSLVGYQNVTETISNGEIGRIEYGFQMSPDNNNANLFPAPSTSTHLNNGVLTSKTIYKKDQTSPIKQTNYDYSTLNAKSYWGFTINPGFKESIFCGDLGDVTGYRTVKNFMLTCFYPIPQGKVLPSSEIEYVFNTVGTPPIINTTQYVYNPEGLLSKKTLTSLPNGNLTETYKYPKDMQNTEPYDTMAFYNILTPIVENTVEQNGSVILKKTNYENPYPRIFVPSSIQMQKGSNALETRITYNDYDSYGNPLYIVKDDADKVVYLWGYNYQYPIAKIENATLNDVKTALGYSSNSQLEGLAAQSNPDVSWVDSQLRNYFNGKTTLVTTYTYRPLVGMTSVTDPRGVKTTYVYDDFGRLQTIKDMNNNTIETYEYHYKN
jgi:YD repeat-containing protein